MELSTEGTLRFLQTYAPGQSIFQVGDNGSHMYVVQDGSVEIFTENEDRRTLLGRVPKGKFFGEVALVDKAPRTASAIAGATGAQVLAIDRAHFIYLVSQQPAFALIVMEVLVSRLRANTGETKTEERAA